MHGIRTALVALCLVGAVGSVTALAQTNPPPAAEKKDDDSSGWTARKWKEMRAKWAQEKDKWRSCRAEEKEKGLKGKDGLLFLKDCMTRS